MIRGLLSAVPRSIASSLFSKSCQKTSEFLRCSSLITNQQNASFSSLLPGAVHSSQSPSQFIAKYNKPLLLEPKVSPQEQVRTVIKFSLQKGRRKTVKTVTRRFFRLHWGIWIRPMAGRRRLWLKTQARKNRLLNYVFCNVTQSVMLDKMVNKFWRKPKYYIDDPYAVYHQRENFYLSRKKPWRPEGVDYE